LETKGFAQPRQAKGESPTATKEERRGEKNASENGEDPRMTIKTSIRKKSGPEKKKYSG